jgi:2-oxoisovalerate dehydrogenase E1 component
MVKDLIVNSYFESGMIKFLPIPIFKYQNNLSQEVAKGNLSRKKCFELLEQLFMIRALEDMLVQISAGNYKPLPGFNYIGPTHLSIGQEATSVGAISAICHNDYITSSHRGHGDALAKGYNIIKSLNKEALEKLLQKRKKYLLSIGKAFDTGDSKDMLEEKLLRIHLYRMIAELFGKADGYCRGVGGGMHIADFELGHLGANAIVGGHLGIATGAAMSCRFQKNNKIVLCLAGDGAYSNGVVFESLNLSTMAQFKNGLMSSKFGVPIIYGIVNNHYAMSGQEIGEITGLDYLARRAAAFDLNNMNAEVVDGMNVLAVLDAVKRAKAVIANGEGPALLEFITYRYKGHSLSDPLTYRDREELALWQKKDPIEMFKHELLEASFPENQGGKITIEEIEALYKKVCIRNEEMAIAAGKTPFPKEESLLSFIFSEKSYLETPENLNYYENIKSLPKNKRNNTGEINTRIAIRESLMEEMERDPRVVIFGEDVADYGGAFGVTNELLKDF